MTSMVNMHALAQLGLLGDAPDSLVTRYTARVPIVSWSVYGDRSTAVLGVADKLTQKGYNANVRYRSATNDLEVILSRGSALNRQAFSVNTANVDVMAAAIAQSINLVSIVAGMLELEGVVDPTQILATAGSPKGREQTSQWFSTQLPDVVNQGGQALCDAFKKAVGVSCKTAGVVVGAVVIGGAGLYALGQVATIARAFSGVPSKRFGKIPRKASYRTAKARR
jgi:hypothetical protein